MKRKFQNHNGDAHLLRFLRPIKSNIQLKIDVHDLADGCAAKGPNIILPQISHITLKYLSDFLRNSVENTLRRRVMKPPRCTLLSCCYGPRLPTDGLLSSILILLHVICLHLLFHRSDTNNSQMFAKCCWAERRGLISGFFSIPSSGILARRLSISVSKWRLGRFISCYPVRISSRPAPGPGQLIPPLNPVYSHTQTFPMQFFPLSVTPQMVHQQLTRTSASLTWARPWACRLEDGCQFVFLSRRMYNGSVSNYIHPRCTNQISRDTIRTAYPCVEILR